MKKSVKMLLILKVLFLALTSCSATANHRQPKADIKQLCIEPPEPVYDRIDPGDSREVQLLKLLNNVTRMRTYILKLKAAIHCLNSTAAIPKHSKHLKFPKFPTVGDSGREVTDAR